MIDLLIGWLAVQDVSWKEQAFLSVCDLLIMFGHGEGGGRLAGLQYIADQQLPEILNQFVQVG